MSKRNIFVSVISPHYQMTKEQFIHHYYDGDGIKLPMCASEISEMIFKDTGYHISRQSIYKWAKQHARRIRPQKEGFRLAVVKQRIDHNKIAAKIDYKKVGRKINYWENARKARRTRMGKEKSVTVRLTQSKYDWLTHFCESNELSHQNFFERCIEAVRMHEHDVQNGIISPAVTDAMRDVYVRTTMSSQATPPSYRREMDELKGVVLDIQQKLQKLTEHK